MLRISLIAMAGKNLLTRPGRSSFLVVGVLLGTCVLTVLVGLSGGFGKIVQEDILSAKQSTLSQLQANLNEQSELLETLPANRIDLLPSDRRPEISETTLREEIQGVEGILEIQPVAFLFPIFSKVELKDFVIKIAGGLRTFDLSKISRPSRRPNLIPTTVYGHSPATLSGHFRAVESETLQHDFQPGGKGDPIPVVVSSQWMDKLNNLRNEEMNERLAEMVSEAMVRETNPKVRKRMKETFKTDLLKGPMAGTIENATKQVYDKLRPQNLRKHLQLVLFPDVNLKTPMSTRIIGHSPKLPFDGIGIPIEYVKQWQKSFFDRTTSTLGKLFSKKPEFQFSRITLITGGLDDTLRLIGEFKKGGFQVEADAESIAGLKRQEEHLRRQKFALEDEGKRFQGFAEVTRLFAVPVAGLMLTLAGIGIAMGLSLSVIEQSRRIGILRAVGARKQHIVFIFLTEALMIGCVGSLLGVGLGELGSVALDHRLRDALSGSTYIPSSLFLLLPSHLIQVFILGTTFSLFAGILPAIMATRIRPVEVLKG
ncbi:MAG: FtsX-like permease family protein [Planctomycetota bacterium]|nr:FtsX-like permease family protein [Planctomycetota bacterium]